MPINPTSQQKVLRVMGKKKLIIIIAVVAILGGAGAMMFMGGGKDPALTRKLPMEPIAFTDPFIVNLADTDNTHYIKLSVAVQVEPMIAADKQVFLHGAASGGHGGGDKETGATRIAAYPPFRDAVIDVVARFRSDELLSPTGKDRLRQALLDKFEDVAKRDEALEGKPIKGEVKDPGLPPYHVHDVFFNEFAVQ